MNIRFKEYTRPEEYLQIYPHNFHTIDSIQDDELLNNLALNLSRLSGAGYEVVLTDLKDYLMAKHEYYPEELKINIRNELLIPYFILSSIRNMFRKKYKEADVIVDTWFPEAIKTFYTLELQQELLKNYRVLFVDFKRIAHYDSRISLRYLIPFISAYFCCRRIIKKHNLDLRRYVYFFFKKIITGLTIKKNIKPKLILSGNDIAFVFITAKIAQAQLILIQNGRRSLSGHFAFKYADHYIAMGDMIHMFSTGLTKHIFNKIYNFGSILLYRKLKETTVKGEIKYDILWVSNLASKIDVNFKSNWNQWYDQQSECKAIKFICDFSKKSSLRIAYQCRIDDEVLDLERANLKSQNITYITPSKQDVYDTLFQSKAVLTPISTICLEGMGLGKKAGFVNLSGNNYLNLYFKDFDIEFNSACPITFEDFVDKVMNQNIDYRDYFIQNYNYISDLMQIIQKITNKR